MSVWPHFCPRFRTGEKCLYGFMFRIIMAIRLWFKIYPPCYASRDVYNSWCCYDFEWSRSGGKWFWSVTAFCSYNSNNIYRVKLTESISHSFVKTSYCIMLPNCIASNMSCSVLSTQVMFTHAICIPTYKQWFLHSIPNPWSNIYIGGLTNTGVGLQTISYFHICWNGSQ